MLLKDLMYYQNDFILKFLYFVRRAIMNLTNEAFVRIQQSFSWIILFGCILIVLLLFFWRKAKEWQRQDSLQLNFASNLSSCSSSYSFSYPKHPTLYCIHQGYNTFCLIALINKVNVSLSVVSDSLRCPGLYSPSGSSGHGILHTRILELVAIPFSMRSS